MVNVIIFILSKLHLGIFAEFEMMTKAKNEGILYVMTQRKVFEMKRNSEMSCTSLCTE